MKKLQQNKQIKYRHLSDSGKKCRQIADMCRPFWSFARTDVQICCKTKPPARHCRAGGIIVLLAIFLVRKGSVLFYTSYFAIIFKSAASISLSVSPSAGVSVPLSR